MLLVFSEHTQVLLRLRPAPRTFFCVFATAPRILCTFALYFAFEPLYQVFSVGARFFLHLRTCSMCCLRIRMFFSTPEHTPPNICACARFSMFPQLLHVFYVCAFEHRLLFSANAQLFLRLRSLSKYFLRICSFFCVCAPAPRTSWFSAKFNYNYHVSMRLLTGSATEHVFLRL